MPGPRARGRHREGKNAHNDFLTLWKEADPKIPMVNKARAEYARLQ
jgi:hypothetical protein